MWYLFVLAVAVIVIFIEYRFRRPDQIILMETSKGLSVRKGRLYPRHFSLALIRTTHSFQLPVTASAKGNLDVRVTLAVTVAASLSDIDALIAAGGWNPSATAIAAKQLEVILQSRVKEYTEQFEVQQLSSEKIGEYLNGKVEPTRKSFGIEVVALTVQSVEPVDPSISEALRRQEHARIMEETENLNQQARLKAAAVKLRTDEEIALMEHTLSVKKMELQSSELAQESLLARKRTEEELTRNRLRLEYEKQELEMLKQSPELLLLTPQAARLAEASQSLKNARTIVSLSNSDIGQGSELLLLFQRMVQNALEKYQQPSELPKT